MGESAKPQTPRMSIRKRHAWFDKAWSAYCPRCKDHEAFYHFASAIEYATKHIRLHRISYDTRQAV